MLLVMGRFFPTIFHSFGKVGTIVVAAGMPWVELVNYTSYGI